MIDPEAMQSTYMMVEDAYRVYDMEAHSYREEETPTEILFLKLLESITAEIREAEAQEDG